MSKSHSDGLIVPFFAFFDTLKTLKGTIRAQEQTLQPLIFHNILSVFSYVDRKGMLDRAFLKIDGSSQSLF